MYSIKYDKDEEKIKKSLKRIFNKYTISDITNIILQFLGNTNIYYGKQYQYNRFVNILECRYIDPVYLGGSYYIHMNLGNCKYNGCLCENFSLHSQINNNKFKIRIGNICFNNNELF